MGISRFSLPSLLFGSDMINIIKSLKEKKSYLCKKKLLFFIEGEKNHPTYNHNLLYWTQHTHTKKKKEKRKLQKYK